MVRSATGFWPWVLAAGLLASAGCGGGAPVVPVSGPQAPVPVDPSQAGTLSVHLVKDGLGAGLERLEVTINRLEVRVDGVWRPVPLAGPAQAQDLLACTSAAPLALAARVDWPQGDNDAIRFTLDPDASVQLRGEAEPRPLAVPHRFVCPMGPPGAFSVTVGEDSDLWIAFGVDQAVQAVGDADAPGYALVPARVRGYERAGTGAITGRVVAPAAIGTLPAGIAGAVVTAQLEVVGGAATGAAAQRTVQADADGNFTLDLLAKGSAYTWAAVSALGMGDPAYAGAAGNPARSLGDGAPYDTFRCLVAPPRALSTATLGGTAAPPGPGQGARVDLVVAFPLDPALALVTPYVVASAPVAADGSFSFGAQVPAGVYTAVLHTSSPGPDLALVDRVQASAPFLATAGADLRIGF